MADKPQSGEIFGVPYNFDRPSVRRLLSSYWQPDDGMLVEKPFGIGYTLNLANWRSWWPWPSSARLLWQEGQSRSGTDRPRRGTRRSHRRLSGEFENRRLFSRSRRVGLCSRSSRPTREGPRGRGTWGRSSSSTSTTRRYRPRNWAPSLPTVPGGLPGGRGTGHRRRLGPVRRRLRWLPGPYSSYVESHVGIERVWRLTEPGTTMEPGSKPSSRTATARSSTPSATSPSATATRRSKIFEGVVRAPSSNLGVTADSATTPSSNTTGRRSRR